MKAHRYLANLAGARPVYLWMFEAACKLLPPPTTNEQRFQLECHASMREIAESLELGHGVVRDSMVQLRNYGWITGHRAPRMLGARVGAKYHLLADLAAEEVVGERDVVSRLVLRLEDLKLERRTKSKSHLEGRGTNREWTADDWTWGNQKSDG